MSAATPTDGSRPTGRPLLVEVAVPVALGLLVLVAALAVAVTASRRLGLPVEVVAVATTVGLTAGMGGWIAWVLRDAALAPLARFRGGLLGLEEGDFDARVPTEGAREFRELAQSFNRAVAIVGHQRERLKALAASDPLTGLANHRSLHEELRRDLEKGERFGVVALDLDGFKQVNDERGHARGDEVLTSVANALRGAVRDGDLVARLAGDEFVLLLRDVDPANVRQSAERARESVRRALPSDLAVGCSAGFVCFPTQIGPDGDLVEAAGAALRVAKRAGGDRVQRYDAEQTAALPTLRAERAEVDALLAEANPVVPVFQPIVELRTGRIAGYEALARFPGPEQRPPDAWFNQASRCGLGPQLEAIAITAALGAPGRPAGTYLSVNLTPSGISSALVRSSLPADLSDVVIELTEHELAPEDGALEAGLADLRGRGARIAIDDAGAGYAGLQQVMRVQPDLIKLDRSLVASVDTDGARAALIEFFVVFARRIGASVCCEGIETPGELAALAGLDVRLGQGYLLGRPNPPWTPLAGAAASAIARSSREAGAAPHTPVNRRLQRTGARR